MEARTHALRTLQPLSFRRFAGAIADVWNVRGEKGGGGFYVAPDPRVVIFLGDSPPPMRFRTGENEACRTGLQGFYIPPGVPLWSHLDDGREMIHLDFHLEASALKQRLNSAGVHADPAIPRLIGASPALVALGRLAAQEVCAPRRGEMLLDGLLSAVLGEIFATPPETAAATGGLTPWQLGAVERHVRENLTRHVSVAELAQVAGLSESWFAHAFKQSRRESPQRWQARLRLEAARRMMADPALSLAEIAHAAGFADQAHLSRQFRAAWGQPPSVWRRGRLQAI